MDALVPRTRCDKGGTRVITEDAELEIRRIRQEYPRLNATQIRDRKAYEEAYFGGMWQAGTCCLPYIKEDGKSRRVYLLMILDGYSRMIVGGKLYYQENAANFQKTLREAVAAYGIPLQ